jgi:hypothetical protein
MRKRLLTGVLVGLCASGCTWTWPFADSRGGPDKPPVVAPALNVPPGPVRPQEVTPGNAHAKARELEDELNADAAGMLGP